MGKLPRSLVQLLHHSGEFFRPLPDCRQCVAVGIAAALRKFSADLATGGVECLDVKIQALGIGWLLPRKLLKDRLQLPFHGLHDLHSLQDDARCALMGEGSARKEANHKEREDSPHGFLQ